MGMNHGATSASGRWFSLGFLLCMAELFLTGVLRKLCCVFFLKANYLRFTHSLLLDISNE